MVFPSKTGSASLLLPRQSMKLPAPCCAAMALRIGVTLKAIKDVVGLQTQLSGAFCSSDRPNAAAAKHYELFTAVDSSDA